MEGSIRWVFVDHLGDSHIHFISEKFIHYLNRIDLRTEPGYEDISELNHGYSWEICKNFTICANSTFLGGRRTFKIDWYRTGLTVETGSVFTDTWEAGCSPADELALSLLSLSWSLRLLEEIDLSSSTTDLKMSAILVETAGEETSVLMLALSSIG